MTRITEGEMSLSEERLRLAVQASKVGLWDWDLKTGKVVFSPEYKAQLGYAVDEIRDDYEEWKSRVHPEDLGPVLARIAQTLASDAEPHETEFRIRHKDGTWRWMIARAQVYRDSSGNPVRMLGCHLDMTDRRKADESVRENQARLAAILDSAADAIVTIDERGVIESVNRAACLMFGYSHEELIGSQLTMLMPQRIREDRHDYLARHPSVGEHLEIGIGRETYALRKDGTEFPVELAVSRIKGQQRFTGIIRDITRRKQLEYEVVEIASLEQRSIGEDLHDTVSQELLALSIHAANLAGTLPEGFVACAEIVGKIIQGLRRSQEELRAVMRRLLPNLVSGEGIMAAFADLAYRTANDNKVICEFECPEPVILEDDIAAMHLYLIGQEAVRNAIKHAAPRKVRIRLDSGDAIRLTVQDDGKGIDSTYKTGAIPEVGGLGLRIMQNRAAIIGAALKIEPTLPVGTRITCTLEMRRHG